MYQLLLDIKGDLLRITLEKWQTIVTLFPSIAAALAMILFGFLLAQAASLLIVGLAQQLKLEFISEKIGLRNFLNRLHVKSNPSRVIAKGVKGYIIFLFFIEATKIAQLKQVADFLAVIIGYIPNVIVALLIMLVGIQIGNGLQTIVATSLNLAQSRTATVLGIVSKTIFIAFAVLAALSQLDIATILVQTLFIGFIGMLMIAGGLAFGLGGKEVVREMLEEMRNGNSRS